MDLHTGDEIPFDECSPATNTTVGANSSTPLDFSESGPWSERLPHADKAIRIKSYLENHTSGDEDQYDDSFEPPKEDTTKDRIKVCNEDFGKAENILTLNLKKLKGKPKDDGGGIDDTQIYVFNLFVAKGKTCIDPACSYTHTANGQIEVKFSGSRGLYAGGGSVTVTVDDISVTATIAGDGTGTMSGPGPVDGFAGNMTILPADPPYNPFPTYIWSTPNFRSFDFGTPKFGECIACTSSSQAQFGKL